MDGRKERWRREGKRERKEEEEEERVEGRGGKRRTRPDRRLPQSRAGGQEPCLRSLDHLGRSREAKDRKNPKNKV